MLTIQNDATRNLVKTLQLLFILCIVWAHELSAATRRVPQEYPTIQAAIDSSAPGDTVLIDNGSYHENVSIRKTLSLIGVSVDGVSLAPWEYFAILIDSARGVTISSMKIYGGTASSGSNGPYAIGIGNSQDIRISSVYAQGGRGYNAICALQHSHAAGPGGDAIYTDNANNVILDSCHLTDGPGGIGIYDARCSLPYGANGKSVVARNSSLVTVNNSSLGTTDRDSSSMIVLNNVVTSANGETQEEIRHVFQLNQNYPNPFNPVTTIEFVLPNSEEVSLDVLDILGREIANLLNGKLNEGHHSVTWNAANTSSGVYFYRLNTRMRSETKKFILQK